MKMIFDSDNYVVIHIVMNETEEFKPSVEEATHGFEIVDKNVAKSLFITGDLAMLFRQQIASWESETPSLDMVEATLGGYAELAQIPVMLH